MYLAILNDSRFYEFLLQVDRDLAEEVRRSGCRFCGAPLHSARYGRKPRGLPAGIDPGPQFPRCFSFCCSAEGCRRRHQPPSVRFLGRKIYLAAMVALLTAMRQGPMPRTTRQLKELFGADRQTLARWRAWWQAIFPRTRFWQRVRAWFMPLVGEAGLPQSLIIRFTGSGTQERVAQLLRFLSGLCRAL